MISSTFSNESCADAPETFMENRDRLPDLVGSRHQFESFELDAVNGELRMGWARLALQPQPFKVLALLVARAGRIVTREEIRQELWSSQTFVDFQSGLNFCIRQIRKTLGEDARKPRYIETLHRRGYRFVAKVSRIDDPILPHRPVAPVSSCMSRSAALAVLPLRDIGGSCRSEFLADGITELLITFLSANRSLRVVSRTTSMRYKDSDKTLCRIGEELRAGRVLEGAVLYSGMRVRLTARLIDTSLDRTVWAACYDAQMQDRLLVQEHLAAAVARDALVYLMPLAGGDENSAPWNELASPAPKGASRILTLPLGALPASQTVKVPMVSRLAMAANRHLHSGAPQI
jgi:TolB-like protein